MIKLEQKFLLWIEEHLFLLFFIIVSILGCLIRLTGKTYVSADARVFLLPWFDQIKESGGLRALGNQVGDYNIPYQCLIALFTYLPFGALTLYKGLSIIFDYFLAFGTALLVCESVKKKISNLSSVFVMVYATVLFLPTTIMNSSIWAQCDSIYTSFVVFSLLFLLRKKYKIAFAFLGLAFSFKLQAVFILPFFLFYYFSEKKFSFLNFFITVSFFYIPSIPGFLYGRSLLDPIKIYLNQSNCYRWMWLSFPSFWSFAGENYEVLSKIAIIFTIFILGCGLLYVLSAKVDLCDPHIFLKIGIWSVWTCLLFLPAMHDRYGYILEIMLLALVFVDRKYFYAIAIAETTSIITYGHFLFQSSINIQILAVFYFAAYLLYSSMIVSDSKSNSVFKQLESSQKGFVDSIRKDSGKQP